MEPTKEEYDKIISRIENHMNYNDLYREMSQYEKNEIIQQKVEKHFTTFLNNKEQSVINEIIVRNFKENHEYSGEGILQNGNRLCWEIQIVVSYYNNNISKSHMEKWYDQEYLNEFANIIKSKKL